MCNSSWFSRSHCVLYAYQKIHRFVMKNEFNWRHYSAIDYAVVFQPDDLATEAAALMEDSWVLYKVTTG